MNIKHLPRFFFLFLTSAILFNTVSGQTLVGKKEKINFTGFTVSTKQNKISINWSTDSSTPTNYFEIQKSGDGKNFRTIALVLGPDPKQQDANHYGCFDKFIPEEANHSIYRIKHIDTDGFEQLSDTKTISKI